jgi:hypothetical protein
LQSWQEALEELLTKQRIDANEKKEAVGKVRLSVHPAVMCGRLAVMCDG